MIAQNFWFVMAIACLLWYTVLTLYVSVKGGFDIKSMLKKLSSKQQDEKENES